MMASCSLLPIACGHSTRRSSIESTSCLKYEPLGGIGKAACEVVWRSFLDRAAATAGPAVCQDSVFAEDCQSPDILLVATTKHG